MAPDAEAEEADQDAGVDHHLRAEERLAREDRQHLGYDAERGQDQDVDLRVAEDPEEMLPQMQVGAGAHVVEVRAEEAIEQQEDQADGDGREGEHDQELHHQRHPHEERHAHQRHAGRPHVEDGRDEVHGGDDRRRAEHLQRQHPEVDGRPRREGPRREVGVAEPADVGRRADEKARVEEEGAGEEDPVRERIQAREGHVPRADHERDHVVEEGRVERHHAEEDHRGAVHGEQRVVGLGTHHTQVRTQQLRPDQHRFEPADQQEREGGDAVENADPLVVDGRDPRHHRRQRGRRCPGGGDGGVRARRSVDAHLRLTR